MRSNAVPSSLVETFHVEESRAGHAWLYEDSHLYIINGVKHAFIRTERDVHHFAVLDNLSITVRLTDAEIASLKDKRVFRTVRHYFLESTPTRVSGKAVTLSDLSSADQREIFFRQAICDAIIRAVDAGKATLSDDGMRDAAENAYNSWLASDVKTMTKDGRSGSKYDAKMLIMPAPSTVRGWLRRYKASNFDIMSLAKNYGRSGNRTPRLGDEESKLLRKAAARYMSRLKPTKASLYVDLEDVIKLINLKRKRSSKPLRQLVCPSRRSFERALDRLDPFQVLAARHGEEYAKRKLMILADGVTAHRPLERVEMDEWTIPLQTLLMNAGVWAKLPEKEKAKVKKQRLYLSTAIDTATRIVLSCRMVFTPSGSTAVATAAMATRDKTDVAKTAGAQMPWDQHGTYETAVTDTGSSWLDHAFRAANVDMGARLHIAPAKSPTARGRQERLYRTLHDMLISRFSGRSFVNVVDKGDYDSEANAVLDYEELGRAIVRFIVDVYHLRPHAGLQGATPYDRWNEMRKTYRVLPPPDEDTARHIFGVTMERRIGGHGVRVLGLNYQSEDLQRLRSKSQGKLVLVRMDPDDIGRVSVKTAHGWISVRCERKGFDRVSMTTWLMAALRIRKENEARAKVHEMVVLAAMQAIRALSARADRRAGIAAPVISYADIERFERDLFKTFRLDDGEDIEAAYQAMHAAPSDGAEADAAPAPAQVKRSSGHSVNEAMFDNDDDYGVED